MWGAPTWPPTPPNAPSAPGNPGRSSIAALALADLAAGRDGLVDVEQDDLAALVVGADHEHLGDEGTDPPGREVHDSDHAPPDQLGGGVVRGDLGARALRAELGPKVDPQLERGATGLGKRLGVGDDADTHVDFLEICLL